MGQHIKVYVRVRPLGIGEVLKKGVTPSGPQSLIHRGRTVENQYHFDHVFGETASQEEIYNRVTQSLLPSCLQGINSTIIFYGQTASGKTYTCLGETQQLGIIPRLLGDLFTRIQHRGSDKDVRLKMQAVEIYNEAIRDLLTTHSRKLKIREERKGFFVEGASFQYVSDLNEAMLVLKRISENRVTQQTHMNIHSSRSHVLYFLTVTQQIFSNGDSRIARITIADLAGSERISKTGVEGIRFMEAVKINNSLLALGEVIKALSDDAPHIPFRNSKLTRLLQESLEGNALTSIIITVSANLDNQAQSGISLRFGQRAKFIKCAPRINRHFTIEELKQRLVLAEQTIRRQSRIIERLNGENNEHYTMVLLNSDDQDSITPTQQQIPRNNSLFDLEGERNRLHTYHQSKNSRIHSAADLFKTASVHKIIEIEPQFITQEDTPSQQETPSSSVNLSYQDLKRKYDRLYVDHELLQNKFKVGQQQHQLMKKTLVLKQQKIVKLRDKNKRLKLEIEEEISNITKHWEQFYNNAMQPSNVSDCPNYDDQLRVPILRPQSTPSSSIYSPPF